MRKLDEMLTPKQQEFFFAEDKRLNFLTGSVRSGKTYVSLLKFAMLVASAPKDSRFLFCGVTLTSLKRNCLDLLMDLVGKNNMSYSMAMKEGKLFGRTIFLEGASDSTSEQKIRGLTLAGAYCDEVTLYKENFFSMLLSRLSVKGAKLYATCNPDRPSHFIKKKFIDNKELDSANWVFMIKDNTFLEAEYIENIQKEYSGVFYDRYILGKWVNAEGLIFPMFEGASGRATFGKGETYADYTLSIDYGTQNAFAGILWGLHNGVWYAIDEYYYSGRDTGQPKTDSEYAEAIEEWLSKYIDIEGRPERLRTIVDPSAASFIVTLKRSGKYKVLKADNEVLNGIRETATAMKRGYIKVNPDMEHWYEEVAGYSWDEKATEDKPIKEADHLMDATRYFVKTMRLNKKHTDSYSPMWAM